MRDINSSLTALLTFGTLYLQQSFVAPVWLFLNVIQVYVQQFFTLFLTICVYVCLCILCCVFYCDASGRLILLLLIN